MDNVSFITKTNPNGQEIEYAIIDRGNGEFTSMTKEFYEAQVAAQSTPIVTEDE
jgi:hypothetical protein